MATSYWLFTAHGHVSTGYCFSSPASGGHGLNVAGEWRSFTRRVELVHLMCDVTDWSWQTGHHGMRLVNAEMTRGGRRRCFKRRHVAAQGGGCWAWYFLAFLPGPFSDLSLLLGFYFGLLTCINAIFLCFLQQNLPFFSFDIFMQQYTFNPTK